MRGRLRCAPLLACAALACSGGDAAPKQGAEKDFNAAAATMLQGGLDEATVAARAADDAKRKAQFEAEKAAREKREAAFNEVVKTHAVVPENAPKKLEDACTAMLDAVHQFKLKQHEGNDRALLNWYGEKNATLGEWRVKCMAVADAKVANCQANLMANAPGGLLDRELELMKVCVEKYAANAGAPTDKPNP